MGKNLIALLFFISYVILHASSVHATAPDCDQSKLAGDYNCDGLVSLQDLTDWIDEFRERESLIYFEYFRRAYYSNDVPTPTPDDNTPSPTEVPTPTSDPVHTPTPTVTPHPFPVQKDHLNFCVNFNLIQFAPEYYSSQAFLDKIRSFNFDYIRIPGGTIGNYWDWSRGGLADPDHIRDIIAHPDADIKYSNAYYAQTHHTIENVSTLLKNLNVPPIFTVNMMSSTLDEQVSYLKEFEAQGIPIRYIELGNEYYFDHEDNELPNPSPENYIVLSTDWKNRLNQEFPDAEIAFVGRRVTDGNPDTEPWNSIVKDIPLDNAIVHYYEQPRVYALQEQLDCGNITRDCVMDRYDITTAEWEKILGAGFFDTRIIDDSSSSLDGKRLWVTEFHVAELPIVRTAGTWGNGLFLVNQAVSVLPREDIEMACVHVMTSWFHWSMIYRQDWELSAGGYAMQYLGEALDDALSMDPITISNAEQVTVTYEGENFTYKQQYGYLFGNANNQSKILLVNLSDSGKNVDISEYKSSGTFKQLNQQPGKAVFTPQDITERTESFSDGTIWLRPYSLTLIE